MEPRKATSVDLQIAHAVTAGALGSHCAPARRRCRRSREGSRAVTPDAEGFAAALCREWLLRQIKLHAEHRGHPGENDLRELRRRIESQAVKGLLVLWLLGFAARPGGRRWYYW
jgi:hypothetical protein